MKVNDNKSIKAGRKEFTRLFYRKNKTCFAITLFATCMMGIGNLLISWLMQQIIDICSGGDSGFSLTEIVYICVFSIIGMALLMILELYARPRFLKQAMLNYKNRAFELISKKSISSFNGENTSVYISALTNDTTSIENNYLSKIFTLIMELLMFVGSLAMMLYYSPLLTGAAIGLSVIPIVCSILTGSKLAVAEKRVSDENQNFLGAVKDMLSGFSVIKSFRAEVQIIKLFNDNNKKAENAKLYRRRIESVIQIIGLTTGFVAQFGVFLIGAYLALSGKGVTPGVVILFVQLMNFVLTPISDVPSVLANRKAACALIDKLVSALSENVRKEGKDVDGILDDCIDIKDLSFSYNDNEKVLNNVSYRFEAGKSYAIVGGSGSGKSTLLNLLMGSSEGYSGTISYDGDELRDINSDSLYGLVSIVQQNVFIFNSTVKDNITMFSEFPEEKTRRAACLSGLTGLIDEKGADYMCGESGTGLSGGERQRVSIARCLLRGTPVLLADEATASLDAETARSVTDAILDISGLTRIIVTHRLEEAVMKRYDGIIVMKNGEITESGRFDELMERKEYFYSLFTVSQ